MNEYKKLETSPQCYVILRVTQLLIKMRLLVARISKAVVIDLRLHGGTVPPMIGFAAFFISIFLWVAATFGPGIYMLRPLDRAARQRTSRVQFTIVDFLALTAHLSIPLA
jgi:hypothetical protein